MFCKLGFQIIKCIGLGDCNSEVCCWHLFLLFTRFCLHRMTGRFPLPDDIAIRAAALPPPTETMVSGLVSSGLLAVC